MPATIEERATSPEISYGNDASAQVVYVVRGTEDVNEARDLLIATPRTLEIEDGIVLLRQSAKMAILGPDIFEFTVDFKPIPGAPDVEGIPAKFTLDTTGGTQKVTQSLQTVASYALSGHYAPDYKQAINVTADSVEGLDITFPALKFTESYIFPKLSVTRSYVAELAYLTSTVNDAPFRGHPEGSVKFIGVQGGNNDQGDFELTFSFEVSPNKDDITFPGISETISKKGWEYLWIRYQDDTDETAKALVKKPVAVFVEQVFYETDFARLGIGTV